MEVGSTGVSAEAFVEVSIERRLSGVTFLVDDLEMAVASVPDTRELLVFAQAGAESPLDLDWVEVRPLLPPSVHCLDVGYGALLWYPADGDAHDLVKGLHASPRNGTSYARGKVGRSFLLDGVDDVVWVPDSADLAPQDFTLAAWVYPQVLPAAGRRSALIAKQATGQPASHGLASFMLALDDRGRCVVTSWDGVTETETLSDASLQPGEWYHVTATRHSEAVHLFINGEAVASGSMSSSLLYSSQAGFDLELGSFLRLGAREPFSGRLDEVILFDRGLSAAEIQSIVKAGSAGYCRPSEGEAR